MIFVTGDIHGSNSINKLSKRWWKEGASLTKDDVVIILGDFGLLWSNTPDAEERWWLQWLDNCPWTTLFLDGNHENHDRLEALPTETIYGGTVGRVSDSVLHLKRGQIYTIDGTTLLTVGGAESIDKNRRQEFVSWWSQELLSAEDIRRTMNTLEKHNNTVAYVLTHTCPTEAFQLIDVLFKGDDPTMDELQQAVANVTTFDHWYFGHMHLDEKLNDSYTAVYRNIIRLGEKNDEDNKDGKDA